MVLYLLPKRQVLGFKAFIVKMSSIVISVERFEDFNTIMPEFGIGTYLLRNIICLEGWSRLRVIWKRGHYSKIIFVLISAMGHQKRLELYVDLVKSRAIMYSSEILRVRELEQDWGLFSTLGILPLRKNSLPQLYNTTRYLCYYTQV